MKKQFYFVRHGETDWNKINKLQGITDVELNLNGENQAKTLAKKVAKLNIQHIYSSNLKRASKTAEILAKQFSLPVKISPLLCEICFGDLEGKNFSEFSDDMKRLHRAVVEGDVNILDSDFVFPNGETFGHALSCFKQFMNELPKDFNNILLVSHGAFIESVLLNYVNKDILLKNCTCLSFEYDVDTDSLDIKGII